MRYLPGPVDPNKELTNSKKTKKTCEKGSTARPPGESGGRQPPGKKKNPESGNPDSG